MKQCLQHPLPFQKDGGVFADVRACTKDRQLAAHAVEMKTEIQRMVDDGWNLAYCDWLRNQTTRVSHAGYSMWFGEGVPVMKRRWYPQKKNKQ